MNIFSNMALMPLLFALPVWADEPVKLDSAPQPVLIVSKMPWVGLEVGQLNDAMRAHATGVPAGIGFLVTSVTSGGPAEKAGVRSFDILWKLNDQLLVNEAQLGTLLQMHRVGDSVQLSIVRSGEKEELEVKLGEAPQRHSSEGISPMDIPLVPMGVPGLPRSIVYPGERKAEVSREDGGKAELRYEEGEAIVLISDAEGETIYDGPVRKDGRMLIPDGWQRSVGALLRTMHQAREGNWQPRRPRPRVVTPPPSRDR